MNEQAQEGAEGASDNARRQDLHEPEAMTAHNPNRTLDEAQAAGRDEGAADDALLSREERREEAAGRMVEHFAQLAETQTETQAMENAAANEAALQQWAQSLNQVHDNVQDHQMQIHPINGLPFPREDLDPETEQVLSHHVHELLATGQALTRQVRQVQEDIGIISAGGRLQQQQSIGNPQPQSSTGTGTSESKCIGLRSSWKRVNAGGTCPCPRSGAASVALSVKGTSYLYVLGGYGGEIRLGDFHRFNFSTRQWSCIDNLDLCPSPRENNGFVSLGHCLILFGGYDGNTWLNDLWEFDTLSERWRLIDAQGQIPSPRFGFVSVSYRNKLILFGGYSGTMWLNDMYEFDYGSKQWTQIVDVTGVIPSERSCPSWALYGDSIIMFGGYDGVHRKNDLYEYNIPKRCWSEITCEEGNRPHGRDFHACGICGNSLIVFGGYNGRERLNDLHRFSFETKRWTKIQVEGEVPSGRSSLVAHIHDNSFFVFGGYNGGQVLNEFFEHPFMCVNVQPSQLKPDLAKLVDHPEFSDITFLVEGRRVGAVRALLAVRSEHFRALLFGGMRESSAARIRGDSNNISRDGATAAGGGNTNDFESHLPVNNQDLDQDDAIVLHDMQYDVFMAVLEFLYTDSCDIPADLALPLLIASERYLLPRLKSLCEEVILSSISLDNAVDILLQSYLHNTSSLKSICLEFIVDNIVLLRSMPQFQALKQEPDLLMEIVMRSSAHLLPAVPTTSTSPPISPETSTSTAL